MSNKSLFLPLSIGTFLLICFCIQPVIAQEVGKITTGSKTAVAKTYIAKTVVSKTDGAKTDGAKTVVAKTVAAEKTKADSHPVSTQYTNAAASLKVSGEVTKPLSLTKEDLSKMERTTAILKDRDGKDVPYTGVKVQHILELAGVTMGKKLRGENLSKYLLVKCADGYEVIFSLAEIDNGFTDKLIILADQAKGADLPLDKGPFRIIVQGDKVPARSSFQVTEMIIGFPKE